MPLVRITWSPEQVARGLPDFARTIDPVWSVDAATGEGWSLCCEFDLPPRAQGNPSVARAHFLMDDAPAAWMEPGARLALFERGTGRHARVEVLP